MDRAGMNKVSRKGRNEAWKLLRRNRLVVDPRCKLLGFSDCSSLVVARGGSKISAYGDAEKLESVPLISFSATLSFQDFPIP